MKPALPRVANLDDSLATALKSAGYSFLDQQYKRVRLPIKGGPDLRFSGFEVAKIAESKNKPQWAELILYAIEGGGFAAVKGWHSDIEGQDTFWTGGSVTTVREAMEAWDWLQLAKSLAKRLEWDVSLHLGLRQD